MVRVAVRTDNKVWKLQLEPFSLSNSRNRIIDYLENRKWLKTVIDKNEKLSLEKIVRGTSKSEEGLTGYGNIIIDYKAMDGSGMKEEDMIISLNDIYAFITNPSPPRPAGDDGAESYLLPVK